MITLGLYNRLVETTCEKMDVSRKDVESRTHRHAAAHTRWIIWDIMRDVYEMSIAQTAHYCGRHRTTVAHGYQQFPKLIEREPELKLIRDVVRRHLALA